MAVTAGLIAGGAAIAGGGLSFLGGQSQAKSSKAAMDAYINNLMQQRNIFLGTPESQAIRARLNEYLTGTRGYDSTLLGGMKGEVYKDYGNSLADMSRIMKQSGSGGSTGV